MGLTGLAFVFLVVLIAAASFQPFGEEGPTKAPEETLATLGVAPGAESQQAAKPNKIPPEVLDTKPLASPDDLVEPLKIDESKELTEI